MATISSNRFITRSSIAKFIALTVFFFAVIFPMSMNAMEVLGYVYREDSILHLENDTLFRQNE